MDNVKKILRYVVILIALYFFSKFIIYIGLNSTYKNIEVRGNTPRQIEVEFAQATKVNGRILGKIKNSEDENLNGKYIKTDIYNSKDELLGTKYLELTDLQENETKKFAVADQKEENAEKLFEGIFLSEDLKKRVIISTLIYAIFFA